MGTCYYLIREFAKVVYDLGKAYGWREVFGNHPISFKPDDAEALGELLAAKSAERGWGKVPDGYYRRVAVDLIDWSEGQPFVFVDENDGRLERIEMDGYPDNMKEHDEYITGSRFTDRMAALAEKRSASRTAS